MRLLPSPCFKPAMRQAVISGRKTNTRRLAFRPDGKRASVRDTHLIPPHALPGDYWYLLEPLYNLVGFAYYDTDKSKVMHAGEHVTWRWQNQGIPQIFLPRIYARYFMRLVSVSLQHVQDIHPEDARAEGVVNNDTTPHRQDQFVPAFAQLWDSIHTEAGNRWADNPVVWAYSFGLVNPSKPAAHRRLYRSLIAAAQSK